MLGKSLCVICKILGLFVNLLTADEKYSLLNRDYLSQHFQIQLSQKRKMLSEFFFAFSKSRLNLNTFRKKMTLIADVFLNLRTAKNVAK